MKKLSLFVLVGIALAGCGIDQMIRDDDVKEARGKCVEYGFQPSSVEFSQCVQRSVEGVEKERDRSFRDTEKRIHDDEEKNKRK